MKQYCEELSAFNKVHRLIGNVSCETLLLEATTSIETSAAALASFNVMVDVGAGAGILGYAWLESSLDRQVVFLEPDRKAQAFLHSYFGSNPRAKVLGCRLEEMIPSMVQSFAPDLDKVFLAARAFSASSTLEDIYIQSALSFPLFVFEKHTLGFGLVKKF